MFSVSNYNVGNQVTGVSKLWYCVLILKFLWIKNLLSMKQQLIEKSCWPSCCETLPSGTKNKSGKFIDLCVTYVCVLWQPMGVAGSVSGSTPRPHWRCRSSSGRPSITSGPAQFRRTARSWDESAHGRPTFLLRGEWVQQSQTGGGTWTSRKLTSATSVLQCVTGRYQSSDRWKVCFDEPPHRKKLSIVESDVENILL